MQIVSLDDAACIAYSATFNQEQDVYFLRIDQPLTLQISQAAGQVLLSWNAVVGRSYCLQYKSSLTAPWLVGTNQMCLVATNTLMTVPDEVAAGNSQRYYRLVREP
jgi:hypothetical protein